MIRDPSDGSVRQAVITEPEISAPVELDPISEAMLAGKVRPERLSEEWVYQRGWNDGIEFALRQYHQRRGK